MPGFSGQRYAGVEGEFRVSRPDGGELPLDELIGRSPRFFFSEEAHLAVIEDSGQEGRELEGGKYWTWYGGTIYNDSDAQGTLVELTTPLTPVKYGSSALVENVMVQRAQLLELVEGPQIIGVSTHLNLLLDSEFDGDDLCRFQVPLPSNAFSSVPGQKLGADIALVATRTFAPVVAWLLFNREPHKGALYRPRDKRRMELCLPYIPSREQMVAGFTFWFAAVDYITGLIKQDLGQYPDWRAVYTRPDYYQRLLGKFPYVLSDITYQRPSFQLGYQLDSSFEYRIMEVGSRASFNTRKGKVNVRRLAGAALELLGPTLEVVASPAERLVLQDYISGKKVLGLDHDVPNPLLTLNKETFTVQYGSNPSDCLRRHKVTDISAIHFKLLKDPVRVVSPWSAADPRRVIRNIGREIAWEHFNLEVIEEDDRWVRRYWLKLSLDDVDEYLRLEDYCGGSGDFISEISKWVQSVASFPNPRRLFVYGTLMVPGQAAKFGARVTGLSKAHTYGRAYDFGDYPLLVEEPGGGVVEGDVLEIENFEEAASKLDHYEGCHEPNPVFIRVLRQVVLGDYTRVPSWIYAGNRNNRYVREKLLKAPRLSGRWAKPGLRLPSSAEWFGPLGPLGKTG